MTTAFFFIEEILFFFLALHNGVLLLLASFAAVITLKMQAASVSISTAILWGQEGLYMHPGGDTTWNKLAGTILCHIKHLHPAAEIFSLKDYCFPSICKCTNSPWLFLLTLISQISQFNVSNFILPFCDACFNPPTHPNFRLYIGSGVWMIQSYHSWIKWNAMLEVIESFRFAGVPCASLSVRSGFLPVASKQREIGLHLFITSISVLIRSDWGSAQKVWTSA